MGIKYVINEKFFNSWSSRMAYVLGYIYADGTLVDTPYNRAKYVSITSTDKQTLSRIKEWMISDHTIRKLKSPARNKPTYIFRFGNHVIYEDLQKIGLYPNKSLSIQMPKIPQMYLADFVRGYFDGDGCVYLEKTSSGSIRCMKTIFTSGSEKFLSQLSDMLSKHVDLAVRRVYVSRRSYQLRYGTKDSMKLFDFLYEKAPRHSFLQRKFDLFKTYATLPRNIEAISNITKSILRYHNGLVAK